MAVAKTQVAHHPQHWQLNTLGTESIGPVTLGAGQSSASSIAGGFLMLPFNYKIVKVGVSFFSCDSVAGTDLFNLVVAQSGTAYTAGNVAGNDNSFAQSFQPGPLQTAANYPAPAPAFGLGYPSNVALNNTPVFLADIPFSSAATYAYIPSSPISTSIPNPSTATPNLPYGFQGFGWVTCGTTGGYGIFLPANYDAVYPANIPLTLRATTTAVTGAVASLVITIFYEPMYLRPTAPGPNPNFYPGQDF